MSATPSVTSILAPDWGEDLSATELIAQEKSNLHKELEWLLRMEVPAVFMQLGLMLKDCAQTLAGPSGVSSAVAQASVFTAPITNTSDSVKGFAMLEGSRIIKADVTVRFSKWNKSLPISTSITSKEPWILSQIQNATNYVQLALSELDDSSLQHGLFHTREQVQSVMDRVMAFLRKAQDQLLFQSNLFPYNIDDLQLNAFNPRLPADLFVDFSINYAALNVSVYACTLLGTNQPARKPSSVARKKADMLIGYVHETPYGTRFEIVDHDEVECPIPSLAQSLAHLKSAYELCQRMKDKCTVRMSRLKPAPATKRLGAEYALISKQDHGAPSTGVSLKDRAAQERLFRDVLEQLQPHIAAVESGQWMQAQEARTDKLEPIVAACRKLREGVYALAQLDEFSVDVYEAAAQACMAAQRNDELHKTLVVLVREIYPAVAIGLDPARARRRLDFIGCLALRLLCQDANSGEFNSLLQQLSRADIESPPLQFVLAVHGAVSLRRFRAFFKLCRSASPWHALVLETFKSNVRQTAISILTASFPSLPLSVLAHWLELTDDNCRQFLEQTCRFTADQLGDGLTVTFRSAHSTRVPAPVK